MLYPWSRCGECLATVETRGNAELLERAWQQSGGVSSRAGAHFGGGARVCASSRPSQRPRARSRSRPTRSQRDAVALQARDRTRPSRVSSQRGRHSKKAIARARAHTHTHARKHSPEWVARIRPRPEGQATSRHVDAVAQGALCARGGALARCASSAAKRARLSRPLCSPPLTPAAPHTHNHNQNNSA